MKPIVVAGELNVDLILTGLGTLPSFGTETLATGLCETPGSSSMICALGLARLGERVRFVGRVGHDDRGRYCTRALAAAGIDTRAIAVDTAYPTGVTVALSSAHDRALVTFPGAIATLRADDVDDGVLFGAGHLHVSSYFLQTAMQAGLPDLLARARAAGLTTSLDPGHDPAGLWNAGLVDVLPLLDVFLPNDVEACALTATDDAEAALRTLSTYGPRVVVKAGKQGCLALSGDDLVRVPAYAVDTVDTTGAGDSFDAGFLHGWLARWPLVECLQWASACGALSTRALGGTPAQPTVYEVRAMLSGGAA